MHRIRLVDVLITDLPSETFNLALRCRRYTIPDMKYGEYLSFVSWSACMPAPLMRDCAMTEETIKTIPMLASGIRDWSQT